MNIDIPAWLVSSGTAIPAVCTRHGEPAVVQKPVRFISKPPGWTYALIIAGALPYLIAVLLLRKEVRSPAWPFCARCQQTHKTRALIGIGLLLPLIAFIVISIVAPDADGAAMIWLAIVAIIGFIAGAATLIRGSYRLLPYGFVARDAQTVGFPKAHPAFIAAAAAAYQQTAQP